MTRRAAPGSFGMAMGSPLDTSPDESPSLCRRGRVTTTAPTTRPAARKVIVSEYDDRSPSARARNVQRAGVALRSRFTVNAADQVSPCGGANDVDETEAWRRVEAAPSGNPNEIAVAAPTGAMRSSSRVKATS